MVILGDFTLLASVIAACLIQCVIILFVLVEFTQHYDLVNCLGELPASKDQQMRSNGCCRVSVSLGWRVPNVLSIFPLHFLSAPNLEILALLFFQDVLVPVARILGPASEHDDITA